MSRNTPMPEFPHGYLGAQPKFGEFGLTALSYSDPVIVAQTNEIEVNIGFKGEVKTTISLIHVVDEKEYNEHVFTQTKASVISFVVNMPKAGWWKLQVYALPAKDTSTQLFGVYNYAVNCERVVKPSYPFPKQYAQWKDGCHIYEPMMIHRDLRGPSVRFKVHIPDATAVAVVTGEEWTHLQEASPALWQGNVLLDKYYGKDTRVTLNANFGKDKTSYATLLEYRI